MRIHARYVSHVRMIEGDPKRRHALFNKTHQAGPLGGKSSHVPSIPGRPQISLRWLALVSPEIAPYTAR